MKKTCIFLLMGAVVLSGGELSREKIGTIRNITANQLRQASNPGDPKIKADIIKMVKAKVKPYPATAKLEPLSKAAIAENNKTLQKEFPYKNKEEIAKGAVEKAQAAYPLYKPGDIVQVEYIQNKLYQSLRGKYERERDGEDIYDINGTPVKLGDMLPKYRPLFNSDSNRAARNEYQEIFIGNYDRLKAGFRTKLTTQALADQEKNEKNGYIFFQGNWRQPEFVVNFFHQYFQKEAMLRKKNAPTSRSKK